METQSLEAPTLDRRNDADREAIAEAYERLQAEMARLGITEDDLIDDFEIWRKEQREQAR